MSMLKELILIVEPLAIPVETGVFSKLPPEEYLVLTPISDRLTFYADNEPVFEINEVRISLFTKKNYTQRKKQLTKALLQGDMIITDRQYIGFEVDTKYHHYLIDVKKQYEMEED